MNKGKDHLDSSGAGSQGQKSPGKAQEEDLTSPESPSHLEVQGVPVLVKSLWRSSQKSCHPKSSCSFPLANSLRRSCLEISFWQLDEKGMPWPRRDYQGSSCIPREHEFCVSPLHQNCVGGNQELSRSFFISTHFQGGSSQAKTSTQNTFPRSWA